MAASGLFALTQGPDSLGMAWRTDTWKLTTGLFLTLQSPSSWSQMGWQTSHLPPPRLPWQASSLMLAHRPVWRDATGGRGLCPRWEESLFSGESAFCLPGEIQVSSEARGDDRHCEPFPWHCCLPPPSMALPQESWLSLGGMEVAEPSHKMSQRKQDHLQPEATASVGDCEILSIE